MPVALDPQKRFEVVLESDKDKPAGERPVFVFRHLTAREFMAVSDDYDGLANQNNGREALNSIISILGKGMVGWRNMGSFEFDVAKLPDILTVKEAGELLNAMVHGNQLEPSDAGKSD